MVKVCSSCGLSIPDDAKFCSWCGVAAEIVVPVAVAPPVAAFPAAAAVAPVKPVMVTPTVVAAAPPMVAASAPVAAIAAAPTITVPAAPTIALAPTIPAIRPLAVPTVAVLDQTQRRLRFCNRCGMRIPFGEAKTYMGLVMCDDCFDKELIPTSIPAIPAIAAPALAFGIPTLA